MHCGCSFPSRILPIANLCLAEHNEPEDTCTGDDSNVGALVIHLHKAREGIAGHVRLPRLQEALSVSDGTRCKKLNLEAFIAEQPVLLCNEDW